MAAVDFPLKFPIYVAVDVTASMAGVIHEFSRVLGLAFERFSNRPGLTGIILLSVVSFSDNAIVEIPLADLRKDCLFPSLSAKGTARYSGVFSLLKELIEQDVTGLKTSGTTVLRPAIFFISDGAPIDTNNENGGQGDWSTAFDALTSDDFPYRPNIIAYGIGAADPGVIRKIASRPEFAFLSSLETDLSKAVLGFAVSLERTIVDSGEAALTGEARLMVAKPEGFVQIPDSLL